MTSNLSRLDTLVVKPGHEKQEEQKREETFYVCLMLNKLGVSMGNQLEPIWDEPAPDFYLEYDGQLVGLEVTEAHPKDADGRPLYFQVLRYRAVYGAWKRFRERGGPTLQVRFRFKEGIPTSGPFTQEDVRNLIGQLEHLIDVSGFDPEGGYQRFRMRSEVPDVLSYTIRPCNAAQELWSISGSTTGLNLDHHNIQAGLDNKRLVSLPSPVWLLVYNAGVTRGLPSRVGEAARFQTYRSSFDRAFWLDLMPTELTELEIGL